MRMSTATPWTITHAVAPATIVFALIATPLVLAPPATAQSTEIARTEHLRVHSDPWINLHHFLYQWSRAEEDIGLGRQDVPVPERSDLDGLEAGQRAAWLAAVDFYREHLAERGHFDGVMLRVKDALAWRESGDAPPEAFPDEPAGLASRLGAAMDFYRERWWAEHDRANRAWWDGVRPYVVPHEDFYVETMERAYGGVWDEPLRVDASAYANWQGGYTSLRPDHTVIWSTDPDNKGLSGTEIVFHEAGHQLSLYGPSRRAVESAFDAGGLEAPGNLWHAVIFETSGWATQRVAERTGLEPYTPYTDEGALAELEGWRELWPALDAHWIPFLEGETSRDEALAGLVERFSRPRLPR